MPVPAKPAYSWHTGAQKAHLWFRRNVVLPGTSMCKLGGWLAPGDMILPHLNSLGQGIPLC